MTNPSDGFGMLPCHRLSQSTCETKKMFECDAGEIYKMDQICAHAVVCLRNNKCVCVFLACVLESVIIRASA